MTNKVPPTVTAAPPPHDPYRITSIEQLFSLFDGGNFLAEVLRGHKDLQQDLLFHMEEHGSKGCSGTMTLKIDYALGKSGDVSMGATHDFKPPKKPAASASAYIQDDGAMTLFSPLMTRMHQPVRDATPHDPATGEVRDAD